MKYYYIDTENLLIKSIESENENPVIVANELHVDDVFPTYEWATCKFEEIMEHKPEEARWTINEFGEVESYWENEYSHTTLGSAGNWFDNYDKAQQVAGEIRAVFAKHKAQG